MLKILGKEFNCSERGLDFALGFWELISIYIFQECSFARGLGSAERLPR